MIATFTLCSNRAFSDLLEGMVLKNSSGGRPPDSIFLPLFFHRTQRLLPTFLYGGLYQYLGSENVQENHI